MELCCYSKHFWLTRCVHFMALTILNTFLLSYLLLSASMSVSRSAAGVFMEILNYFEVSKEGGREAILCYTGESSAV